MRSILQVLQLLCLSILVNGMDYCAQESCPFQGTHIRCRNNGSFAADCQGNYTLINLTDHIPLILHKHNTYRNMIASGQLNRFKPASRMPELYWDSSLAENAEYNVKTCVFAHDKCRSTALYPYSGQNIYYTKTKRENLKTEDFINEAIFLWFDEHKDCNYTILESFRKTVPQTGHFCLVVNDRNTYVGCAMMLSILPIEKGQVKSKTFVIITCNYTSTNIRDKPSYKPGPPGSECKSLSKDYKALCADRIDPNDINWYNQE